MAVDLVLDDDTAEHDAITGRPDDVIALVHVLCQEQRVTSNTVAVDWRTLDLCRVDALTADGQRLGAAGKG